MSFVKALQALLCHLCTSDAEWVKWACFRYHTTFLYIHFHSSHSFSLFLISYTFLFFSFFPSHSRLRCDAELIICLALSLPLSHFISLTLISCTHIHTVLGIDAPICRSYFYLVVRFICMRCENLIQLFHLNLLCFNQTLSLSFWYRSVVLCWEVVNMFAFLMRKCLLETFWRSVYVLCFRWKLFFVSEFVCVLLLSFKIRRAACIYSYPL